MYGSKCEQTAVDNLLVAGKIPVCVGPSHFCSCLQASNYDPNAVTDSGTCSYLYQDPETGEKTKGELRDFITSTVGSLFGGKSDSDTGPNWEGTGYAYSGDIVSQRDIDRLVSCLAFA